MMPNVPPKVTSPSKPLEILAMTQEEKDKNFHQIEKVEKKMNEKWEHMEKKMNENGVHMENNMDENSYQMERKMNENQEHMENKMEELKKTRCKELMKM
jgi:uncharacterized protein YwgA